METKKESYRKAALFFVGDRTTHMIRGGVGPACCMGFNYKSKTWKALAACAMKRDGYICQLSKRYGKIVPAEMVHHIYPVDEYPEYAFCLWNLISLSNAMHNTLHDRVTDKLTPDGNALMRRTKPE